jgi:hypothetical protein
METLIDTQRFSVSLPESWTTDSLDTDLELGLLGQFTGDGHVLRVERAMKGLVPVRSFMAQVSFLSRGALAGYEPANEHPVVVLGGGPSFERTVVTDEGDAGSFVMAELFTEGLDNCMWYVRVSAPRARFDAGMASAILDSLHIHFGETNTEEK